MSYTVRALDSEVEIDTARIEVCQIGSGFTVTVTLVDPFGTAILAESSVVPKASLEEALAESERVIRSVKEKLERTVTEASK